MGALVKQPLAFARGSVSLRNQSRYRTPIVGEGYAPFHFQKLYARFRTFAVVCLSCSIFFCSSVIA